MSVVDIGSLLEGDRLQSNGLAVAPSPNCTASAPGNPLKRLSKERFSCMMMTMCLIVVAFVGTGVGVGGGGEAELPPPHPASSIVATNAPNTQ